MPTNRIIPTSHGWWLFSLGPGAAEKKSYQMDWPLSIQSNLSLKMRRISLITMCNLTDLGTDQMKKVESVSHLRNKPFNAQITHSFWVALLAPLILCTYAGQPCYAAQ
jgi:hypothetical protein